MRIPSNPGFFLNELQTQVEVFKPFCTATAKERVKATSLVLELQALPRNLYGFLTFGTAKGASFTFLAQITNIVGTCMRGTIQER